MRLLIITQKVDKNDPILGFFHGWIEEFAKNLEQVTVVCLEQGEFDLPKNVKVLSLGKEEGKNRLKYLFRFYKYIWQEHCNYDSVFVHMNQEYVLLGGLFWRIFNKKISLWRNHLKGSFLTRLAVFISNQVFCTSSQSFTYQFKKTKLMPVGIDTHFFQSDFSISKKLNSILFLGRISPVKNILVFIEALNELKKLEVDFRVTIAGPSSSRDKDYEDIVRNKVNEYGLSNQIKFIGSVNQTEALSLYQKHDLYLNLTPSGSMDKTIFEAMSCDVKPLVYNKDLVEVLGEEFLINGLNPQNIAKDIKRTLFENKRDFRTYVIKNHSLELLVKKLFKE